jgi:hypothetical protein
MVCAPHGKGCILSESERKKERRIKSENGITQRVRCGSSIEMRASSQNGNQDSGAMTLHHSMDRRATSRVIKIGRNF